MNKDEALKLALEALKQCYVYSFAGGVEVRATEHTEAIDAIKEALAQPEQEPSIKQSLTVEPVGFVGARELARIKDFDITLYARGGFDNAIPLYSALQRKEWVNLTDDQITDCVKFEAQDYWRIFGRAIEAKLKELNDE